MWSEGSKVHGVSHGPICCRFSEGGLSDLSSVSLLLPLLWVKSVFWWCQVILINDLPLIFGLSPKAPWLLLPSPTPAPLAVFLTSDHGLWPMWAGNRGVIVRASLPHPSTLLQVYLWNSSQLVCTPCPLIIGRPYAPFEMRQKNMVLSRLERYVCSAYFRHYLCSALFNLSVA